jgi:hypothetical protein
MATVLDPPASPGDLLQGDRGDSRLNRDPALFAREMEDPSAPAGRRRGLKLESKTVRLINAEIRCTASALL